MATIRKRGKRWHVQVRRVGAKAVTRSFVLKEDALAWARATEAAIDRGEYQNNSCLAGMTVGDLLRRYCDTVSVHKRSHANEKIILDAMIARPISQHRLNRATAEIFSTYRDERLQAVKPVTVNRELGLFQHAFDLARYEWALPVGENPVPGVRRPKVGHHRRRRLEDGEEERLLASAGKSRNKLLLPLIRLALETGMRRGELLRIEADHIDWEKSLLSIPLTKNGHPRTIPLKPEAVVLLRDLNGQGSGRLLPLTDYAVRHGWQRICKRAGIEDLHFHDLRHEAISRFFEMGLSVVEVALISGHRDPRMLFRYTHLNPQKVALKMAVP